MWCVYRYSRVSKKRYGRYLVDIVEFSTESAAREHLWFIQEMHGMHGKVRQS